MINKQYYGNKKIIIALISIFIFIILSFISIYFTIKNKDWQYLIFCFALPSYIVMILIFLVNKPSDLIIDYEKQIVKNNIKFNNQNWALSFRDIKDVLIYTKEDIEKFYKKRVPKRAIVIKINEYTIKIIPIKYFSEKQISDILEALKNIEVYNYEE